MDGTAVTSTRDTYYIQLHCRSHTDNHRSFPWYSSWCMKWAHMSRLMDRGGSLASYGHKRICLFRVRSGWGCKIQFCSKTCRSPRLRYSCGSAWPGFTTHNEHMRKIICKGIMRSSLANVCKNTSCSFEDDIVSLRVNEHPNNCHLRDISVLFPHRNTSSWNRNFLPFFCLFHYGSWYTFYDYALQWCYMEWF